MNVINVMRMLHLIKMEVNTKQNTAQAAERRWTVKKMYEDFSNVNIAAELRLYETICRHTEQEAAADLAKRASEVIVELMKERDDLNAQYTKVIYEVMPTWIPVTERLPEKHDRVLVYSKLRGITKDHRCYDGNWYFSIGVTHWMPLPKPPKDGET